MYSDKYVELMEKKFYDTLFETGSVGKSFNAVLQLHDTESALVWDTTCAGCARLLNRLAEIELVEDEVAAVDCE